MDLRRGGVGGRRSPPLGFRNMHQNKLWWPSSFALTSPLTLCFPPFKWINWTYSILACCETSSRGCAFGCQQARQVRRISPQDALCSSSSWILVGYRFGLQARASLCNRTPSLSTLSLGHSRSSVQSFNSESTSLGISGSCPDFPCTLELTKPDFSSLIRLPTSTGEPNRSCPVFLLGVDHKRSAEDVVVIRLDHREPTHGTT